jgi:putative RecB family exonuclease
VRRAYAAPEGVLDLVRDVAAGPAIVDFKTAAKSPEPCELTHEIQLSSYAYLLRQASETQQSELQIRNLVKTKQPKILVHRYPARTEAHFARLFTLVRDYLDALDVGRFSYRPGWTCSSCDFCKGHCSRWAG